MNAYSDIIRTNIHGARCLVVFHIGPTTHIIKMNTYNQYQYPQCLVAIGPATHIIKPFFINCCRSSDYMHSSAEILAVNSILV